jgi:hypothetical protein
MELDVTGRDRLYRTLVGNRTGNQPALLGKQDGNGRTTAKKSPHRRNDSNSLWYFS